MTYLDAIKTIKDIGLPYMVEDDCLEIAEQFKDEFDEPVCSACIGTGEGSYSESTCPTCGGSGEQQLKKAA